MIFFSFGLVRKNFTLRSAFAIQNVVYSLHFKILQIILFTNYNLTYNFTTALCNDQLQQTFSSQYKLSESSYFEMKNQSLYLWERHEELNEIV